MCFETVPDIYRLPLLHGDLMTFSIHHANYPKMHFLSNFLIKNKTNCQFFVTISISICENS